MAPKATTLLFKEKTKVVQNEAQSLIAIQHLFLTTFACIGYLRDLFKEDCFEEQTVADMTLKKFKKGASAESDALVDWLEKGCFDALKRKYLRMAIFGIYLDPVHPLSMTETYTFKVSYPDILTNEQSLDSQVATMTIHQNNTQIGKVNENENDFRKSVVQILRTLCILTQTLKALPEEKYLTMKLYYYDDRTPKFYQPPLFKDCSSKDEDFIFNSDDEVTRINLGTATSLFHSVNVKIKTISDTLPTNEYGTASLKSNIPSQSLNSLSNLSAIGPPYLVPEFHTQKDELEMVNGFQDPISRVGSIEAVPKVDTKDLKSNRNIIDDTLATAKSPPMELFKDERVSCSCGCNENDLDMVYCESCKSWQHTVCMGFYSNKDKRLADNHDIPHMCFQCRFSSTCPSVLPFLGRLASWRRSLSIIFHEGIEGVLSFSRRIGLPLLTAKSIVDKFIKEGFIRKAPHSEFSVDFIQDGGVKNKWRMEVLKGHEVKKKIKSYFDTRLESYPEFVTMKAYDEQRFGRKEIKNDPKCQTNTKDPFNFPNSCRTEDRSTTNDDENPQNGINPKPLQEDPESKRRISFSNKHKNASPVESKDEKNKRRKVSISIKNVKSHCI